MPARDELEKALVRAYETILFLHGCLTDPTYSYKYPEMTERELEGIRNLVEIPDYCLHSQTTPGCPVCEKRA